MEGNNYIGGMIKANELRIGNLIDAGVVTSIEPLSDQGFYKIYTDKYSSTNMEVNPIPLTEEWLLAFGFRKEGEKFFKGIIGLQNSSMKIPSGMKDANFWVVVLIDPVDGQINLIWHLHPKYVHELQNLYFALTGEELEGK